MHNSDHYGVSSSMSDATTDQTRPVGSGKHRGGASSQDDQSARPHGRHRRDDAE
ncbi:hypothetical protein [Streptomyces purpureus]|uniref:hypothetical protein n=1 Tax=Streptomyces purpureus TaxID=1951 RepID=UPI00166FD119|nr:hypothetical protein [Streptomyces purpureus]